MKPKVAELISIARRELRRASGVPLTADEIEQDRRENELKYLRAIVYKAAICIAVFWSSVDRRAHLYFMG